MINVANSLKQKGKFFVYYFFEEVPADIVESIFKSLNFETITKTNFSNIITEFLMSMVKAIAENDKRMDGSKNLAFKIATNRSHTEVTS